MGVNCEILVDNSNQKFKPGDIVCGVVKYYSDKVAEYKELKISLIGEGRCRWEERRFSDRSKDTSFYIGTETLIVQEMNIMDTSKKTITIPPGKHEYPFRFTIPENVPSSYMDNFCSIQYTIEMKFKKASFFSFTKPFCTKIFVSEYLNSVLPEGPIICGLRKNIFTLLSLNTKPIDLKIEISSTFIRPGQAIDMKYCVINSTDVKINCIETKLQSKLTYISNDGKTKELKTTVYGCVVESLCIYGNSRIEFQNKLWTRLDTYTIAHSKVIKRDYNVKVTLKLPLSHINSSVKMPILIGEKPPVKCYPEPPPLYSINPVMCTTKE